MNHRLSLKSYIETKIIWSALIESESNIFFISILFIMPKNWFNVIALTWMIYILFQRTIYCCSFDPILLTFLALSPKTDEFLFFAHCFS
jgi:ABC-type Mn2+/Zn2+ transport system permease subunit